jgi:hypothetical protein
VGGKFFGAFMIWSLWFDSEGKWFNRSTSQLALISMNQLMNDAPLCRQCGKQLPIEFKGVGCPACLLLGMRLKDGDDETFTKRGTQSGER